MSYSGWLCLGNQQIVNDCRTIQRVADGFGPPGLVCRACDPCCGDLSAGLGFPGGYNPTETPWYDGSQDSVDFAGLLITSIEGLEPGPFTRPVTESAGYGAVIGQGRQSAPVVVVEGLLMAATCCAQDFGLRWLRTALRGSCASSGTCNGDDLIFLSCEPQTPDLDCLGPEETFDYEAWLAPYYRTMKGVSLIDGPKVIEKISRACSDCADCQIYKVQFTLAASRPCVFTDPVIIEPEFMSFTCGEIGLDCIEWSSAEACDPDTSDCSTSTDCSTDPDCVSTIAPPTVPAIANPCVEECISVISCRVCADIPAGTFSQNSEGTLIVQIYAGSDALRRINVKVWQNPLDFDPDQLDDCDVCSELNISYLGANSTLTIDGTTRTATIDCPNGLTVRANPFIASGTGSPAFSFPDFDGCVGQYTVCVTTAPGAPTDSWVSISAVGREC